MEILIRYKNKIYNFKFGYEAMIFDCAISNNFDTNYGEDKLESFVNFVSNCYLKAPPDISLGELSDFISSKWVLLKGLSYYEILKKFYSENI